MKLILLSLIAAAGFQAKADDIHISAPSHGGNGCPQGSLTSVVSKKNDLLSLRFNDYEAQAGKSNGKKFERKTCNIAVPVSVPDGWSVAILKGNYRGYLEVPDEATAEFQSEHFMAGPSSPTTGPVVKKVFDGPVLGRYRIEQKPATKDLVWSACGEDVNLRINSSMMVTTNAAKEDVYANVDKIGISFHLQWKKCKMPAVEL